MQTSIGLASDNAGKTIVARGTVDASNIESTRKLNRRDPVFMKDTVSTGANSNTQLRMIDGGLLSLQQESALVVNQYQFNQQGQDDNVSMELLKGGLRTITGALSNSNNNYKLTTPVASIGVRGTHYETELDNGDLYLAVWQGVIDVQVTVGVSLQSFSLGQGEDYQFAIVRANGEVEYHLAIPNQFAQGHSENLLADSQRTLTAMTESETLLQKKPLDYASVPSIYRDISGESEFDIAGASLLDNDDFWIVSSATSPDIVAARQGEFTFNQLAEHSLASSVGDISNLSMSMTVDFDSARVPTGHISFSDSQGEWFAAFNGVIASSSLDININFASHGNALADGEIDGIFVNDASQIFGSIQLSEINNNSIFAGGGFLLQERP